MIKIYVLLLEENKFYVGQTKDIDQRLTFHLKGKLGSEWTKKYKPLKIIEVRESGCHVIEDALKLENAVTIEYMKTYGWKNVRGGDFCTLDEEKLRFLLILNSDIESDLLELKYSQNISINQSGLCLFVLKLKEGNYFVGRTNNLKLAILNECNGLGSEWTSIFKPIELVAVIKIDSSDKKRIRQIHNEYVVKYMKKFGFQNIRGGDFYQVDTRNHKNKVINYTDIFK